MVLLEVAAVQPQLEALRREYVVRARQELHHGSEPELGTAVYAEALLHFYESDSAEELAKALARDRTRVTLNGFTSLGLVEITRKRTRESLAHVLCEPCPTCQARGEIKTAQTVCYEIQREIVREARQFEAKGFRILAAQSVIDMFLDEESQSLAMLIDFIGKPISLAVESQYTQEQFDVVLL